ncbi:GNAT family N-acetyltransferase [Roseitranquillus sediminis]|uniref:GNAT family N-acetyltransferase n=1 Tax=Roseitranquillus sediminis TaxID=2809051 RepID=UPI001D0C83CA|nr:GNAT family protein [Roseitranquillus sediminis]MBM9595775.1 GNAT family N-acetyltransferase [Roseitranquillus sediminis]
MTGPLADWRPPPLPPRTPIEGRYVQLEPLGAEHALALHEAFAEDSEGTIWRFLPVGPFGADGYAKWIEGARLLHDPLHFAVRMEDGRLGGTLSLMRMAPAVGSIEAGWLTFAPRLQRTREATEAVFLLMRWAFESGYRRFEWKCDAANRPSRAAAQRFGLSYEGVFRQAAVVKGRNRDTAWFAAIDAEWPRLREAFETWLASANFDANGRQRHSLAESTRPILVARDPLD